MNQFHWQDNKTANQSSGGKAVNAMPTGLASAPMVTIKPQQPYPAQVQVLVPRQQITQTQNQSSNSKTPVANINVTLPQTNGQTTTVTQAVMQLPKGIIQSQSVEVLLNIGKNGQLVMTFKPPQQNMTASGQVANNTGILPSTNTGGQMIKLTLSDSQIVSLLSLNNQYKPAKNQTNSNSVSTQANLVAAKSTSNQQPTVELKLPGLNSKIALPKDIASLLVGQTKAAVQITSEGKNLQLQITLPKTTASKTATVTVPIAAEKLTPIIKQALQQASSNDSVKIQPQAGGNDKLVFAKGQTLTLPTKTPDNSEAKFAQLSSRQLSIQISPKTPATLGQVTISAQNLTPQLKQAVQSLNQNQIKTTANTPPQITIEPAAAATKEPVKSLLTQTTNQTTSQDKAITQDKATSTTKQPQSQQLPERSSQQVSQQSTQETAQQLVKDAVSKVKNVLTQVRADKQPQDVADTPEVVHTQANKANIDIAAQKQALSQFIDPLIRLLLPKKLNWSEGVNTLKAIEKQLSNQEVAKQVANQTNNSNDTGSADLKTVLNQVRQSMLDQNSPLTEKAIANVIGQTLNYNPTQLSTPSTQPTPANAIASALQLLLGAKVAHSDSQQASNATLEQINQILKNTTGKDGKNPIGIKALTSQLAQAEQTNGSIRALGALQSNVRTQQLENVERRLDGNNQLNFTLPLQVGEQVKDLHIAIEQEKNKAETSSKRLSIWNLTLTFDLDKLGKLLVNAKLKDGEVSMHMYAENQKTLMLMNKFSATLEQRLEFFGVKINNIQSSLGKISDNNSKRQLNNLLQIKV